LSTNTSGCKFHTLHQSNNLMILSHFRQKQCLVGM
jgi:hypothetical protein